MRFLAPELLDGPEEFRTSKASDVYSLSLVLYSAWAHQAPFAEYPNERSAGSAARAGLRPPFYYGPVDVLEGNLFKEMILQEFWALLNSMWEHKPSERPTIQDVEQRIFSLFGNVASS